MKPARTAFLKNALIVCAAILSLSACGKTEHSAQQTANTPAQVVRGVVTETLAATSMPETVEVVGTVRARTSAVVSSRIPGTIIVLKVREGDRVTRGQLLAQLSAPENQAAAALASAGVDEAQRAMDETLSRKKLADSTFERYQRLFNEQAISRQEFDVKLAERDQAQQALARAEARVRQAREGFRAATVVSDYTRIVAPISGVIVSRQADLGATVFPAQPLMTVEEQGSYQLELAVPESLAAKVKPGMSVQVALDSLGSSFTAPITEIVPTAEPGSRTFTVKINLSQKGLKSGMFGRGVITVGPGSSGTSITKAALFERGALTAVWVIDKENIARLRLVKAGKTVGSRVEILSGLSAGERIAIKGMDRIIEGAKVEP